MDMAFVILAVAIVLVVLWTLFAKDDASGTTGGPPSGGSADDHDPRMS